MQERLSGALLVADFFTLSHRLRHRFALSGRHPTQLMLPNSNALWLNPELLSCLCD